MTCNGSDHLFTPLLSPRQEQILTLIADGMTNRQIGDRLGIAEKTVKNAVTGLLAALDLQRRSQAAVYSTIRSQRQPMAKSSADLVETAAIPPWKDRHAGTPKAARPPTERYLPQQEIRTLQ